MYPRRNFLGVDLKGTAIYIGAKIACRKILPMPPFSAPRSIRLPTYFRPGEVEDLAYLSRSPAAEIEGPQKASLIQIPPAYQQILIPEGAST